MKEKVMKRGRKCKQNSEVKSGGAKEKGEEKWRGEERFCHQSECVICWAVRGPLSEIWASL